MPVGEIDFTDKPGWRVEFRPMEVQITDFENAAFSSFITLLSRAILKFKPNLYIPLLKVELNMTLAHKVDSVLNDKFWFKSMDSWNLDYHEFTGYDFTWFDRFLMEGNDVLEDGPVYLKGYASSASIAAMNGKTNGNGVAHNLHMNGSVAENKKGCEGKTVEDVNDVDDFGMDQRYTLNEIINGDGKFPGLISLVIKLIATELVPESCQHCPDTKCAQTLIRLKYYLMLISKRASGEIPTAAHWMRHKVLNNPNYEQDSRVPELINYELIEDIDKLTHLQDKELVTGFFGDVISDYLLSNRVPI